MQRWARGRNVNKALYGLLWLMQHQAARRPISQYRESETTLQVIRINITDRTVKNKISCRFWRLEYCFVLKKSVYYTQTRIYVHMQGSKHRNRDLKQKHSKTNVKNTIQNHPYYTQQKPITVGTAN